MFFALSKAKGVPEWSERNILRNTERLKRMLTKMLRGELL